MQSWSGGGQFVNEVHTKLGTRLSNTLSYWALLSCVCVCVLRERLTTLQLLEILVLRLGSQTTAAVFHCLSGCNLGSS